MNDERLGRIENKLDKVVDRISSIDTTLASQHEILATHIRRTEALEAIVEPMQRVSLMQRGAFALVGIVGSLVGVAAAVFEIIAYFTRKTP